MGPPDVGVVPQPQPRLLLVETVEERPLTEVGSTTRCTTTYLQLEDKERNVGTLEVVTESLRRHQVESGGGSLRRNRRTDEERTKEELY